MPTTATTPTVIDGIVTQLEISRRSVKRNLEGITHDESLRRPEGVNSINWIVGHMLGGRVGVLANLGDQPPVAREKLAEYGRGSSGELTSPMRFEELLELFDRTQEPLVAALQRVSDEKLNAKSPMRSPAGDDATFAQALAAMTLHECYHTGQLGLSRRLIGKKGAI